jgi:glycosyltransferase involved in cell wall biosynthesis
LRVLLTNTTLAHRTGSELYVGEVARALRDRGCRPVVWSPVLGGLAADLAAAGVEVVDDLARIAPDPDLGQDLDPDLIHGQHHLETMTALLRFPATPCVFVCHGWSPWEEAPPRHPRIRRYVAVDEATRERLAGAGVPAERIVTILNFVDLGRFRPRPPLPARPRRALAFGNSASEATCLPALREACRRAGIALDAAGLAAGNPAGRPEDLLPSYDLVFAKGRAALEAMAVGAAVVLCDAEGCGPLVTAADLDRLRPLNFGLRALTAPVEPEVLLRQIERYDPADAATVAARVRREASLDDAVDRLVAVYRAALAEPADRSPAALAEEGRAAAEYLAWLNPFFKERGRLLIDRDELWLQVRGLAGENARLRAVADEVERLRQAAGEVTPLREALAEVRGTAVWRLRERLVARPALARIYRFLRRVV